MCSHWQPSSAFSQFSSGSFRHVHDVQRQGNWCWLRRGSVFSTGGLSQGVSVDVQYMCACTCIYDIHSYMYMYMFQWLRLAIFVKTVPRSKQDADIMTRINHCWSNPKCSSSALGYASPAPCSPATARQLCEHKSLDLDGPRSHLFYLLCMVVSFDCFDLWKIWSRELSERMSSGHVS